MGTLITTITIIILISIIGVLLYFLKNSTELNRTYEATIVELKEDISNTYDRLKVVDINGAFESDDEVGFVFSHLLNMIKSLNSKYNGEQEEDESGLEGV